MTTVVAVLGPTGAGKTRLAARLARELGGEVLVADSRQVYRELDIATNKPLPEEMLGVPFHLTNLADPRLRFSAFEWVAAATAAIGELSAKGLTAVIEGGTMLWVDALLDGFNLAGVPPDAARRAELEELETAELAALASSLDPSAAIDFRNRRRLVRAIETLEALGPPLARARVATPPDWKIVRVGLSVPADRLEASLRVRSYRQVERGLVEETRRALEAGVPPDAPVLTGTGYVEALMHIRGDLTAEQLPERMLIANRQLARRQLRWLRRDARIAWFATEPDPLPAVLALVRSRLG